MFIFNMLTCRFSRSKPVVAVGLDPSTFTLEGVQAMFDQYADEDDNNVIGGKL